jgi:hypothetical protein
MTSRSCKLGLVLPVGLHEQMAALAGGSPRGRRRAGPFQPQPRAFTALWRTSTQASWSSSLCRARRQRELGDAVAAGDPACARSARDWSP